MVATAIIALLWVSLQPSYARSVEVTIKVADADARETARPSWTRVHKRKQMTRLRIVRRARSLLGVPYVFGGTGRRGVDCSGLTRYAYQAAGIALPHLAAAQARMGRWISKRRLRPGDLVVFNRGGHVAMYVGDGYVIAASSARGRVFRQPLDDEWLAVEYDQARRLV